MVYDDKGLIDHEINPKAVRNIKLMGIVSISD
jgi:hypothetical protein